MRPRLLDLFCGAGGCAVGYHKAGFDVVGVDLEPQPEYPFKFVQADALAVIEPGGMSVWDWGWETFDAIHASPPCQRWTRGQRHRKNAEAHPDLIAPLRPLLEQTGLPYVIENVEGAPLNDPVLLCGSMFDMDIRWHRLFETNWDLQPHMWPCRHKIHGPHRYPGTPNGSGKRPGNSVVNPFAKGTSHDLFAEAKGIDWIKAEGRFRPNQSLNDAVPPAYTEFIGRQLLEVVAARQQPTGAV